MLKEKGEPQCKNTEALALLRLNRKFYTHTYATPTVTLAPRKTHLLCAAQATRKAVWAPAGWLWQSLQLIQRYSCLGDGFVDGHLPQ